MTSAPKIESNRANARSSTGPKTAQGRRRSAKNAFRHGLSLPVLSDPAVSEEVVALVRQIVGANANPELRELARQIAEADVALGQVRRVRHELISRAISDAHYDSRAMRNKKLTIALRVIRRCDHFEPVSKEEVKLLFANSTPADRFTTVVAEIARRLPALDRYERRALSRRKMAIRAFDAAEAVRRTISPK